MAYSINDVTPTHEGYGLVIVNERKQPIVLFEYLDQDEAEAAREELLETITNVMRITGFPLP